MIALLKIICIDLIQTPPKKPKIDKGALDGEYGEWKGNGLLE